MSGTSAMEVADDGQHEEEETPPPVEVPVKERLCEVCEMNQRHYKCPRCSTFTCSLECCKKHKLETSCSGRRDRTGYVPISGFTSDNLRNDYHFLEDVLQTKDCAKRTLVTSCGGLSRDHNNSNTNKPRRNQGKKRSQAERDGVDNHGDHDDMGLRLTAPLLLGQRAPPQLLDMHTQGVRNLVKAAAMPGRDTRIIIMAPGMSRRKQNTSHYHNKSDDLYWRVHAVFVVGPVVQGLSYEPSILLRPELETPAESSVSTLNFPNDPSGASYLVGMALKSVSEKATIGSILDKCLEPVAGNTVQRHALRAIRSLRSDIICLTQHIPSPSSNPIFVQVGQADSLQEALRGRSVLEYPSLVFALPGHCSHLRRFVQEAHAEAAEGAEAEVEALSLSSPSGNKMRRLSAQEGAAGMEGEGEEGEDDGDDDDEDEDVSEEEFLKQLKELESEDI